MYPKYARRIVLGLSVMMLAVIGFAACGSTETIIQTVEVIKEVEVVRTVEVEKIVEVETIVTATAEAYGAGPGARTFVQPRAAVQPRQQTGTLIIEVPRISGRFDLTSSPFDGLTSDNWGVVDPLIFADPAEIPKRGAFNPAISLVNGWTVSSDGSSVIFDLRKGVEFHHGFGEMTAEDVAWSFNEALRDGNTNPRTGFVGEWMGEWEVIASHTVKMNIKSNAGLSPVWLLELSNTWRTTLAVTSKKANVENDPLASKVKIGTGPFQMDDGAVDDFVDLSAVAGPHYRSVPSIEFIKIIAMPDAQVKVAAFKAGEIDIVNIPAQFIDGAVDAVPGARIQVLGEGATLHLYAGGNFWQQEDIINDVTIYPREGLKVGPERPWIGDPYAAGCDPDNLFNTVPPAKPACENMESARLFRWALAMAIDRDAINDIIGLGRTPPAYTFTGFRDGDPEWKDDWFIPYDPDAARKILKDLNIPDGFKMTTWITSDSSALPPDIAESAVQFWVDELGLEVEVEATNYNGRRPTLIGRTIDIPFHHHMNAGYADEPKGRLVSAGKGGANRGMELPNPILERTYWANLAELDAVKRIQNNIFLEDYMSYWMLNIPMVFQNGLVAVSPRVKEWSPYTETFGNANSYDTVVLGN
ncbi:MAG: ABC transporter substrate-binding protein [Chloroflexi bacterium]|nr:ABC transporter substrate-binding protein [Chloroflexota bacterium]